MLYVSHSLDEVTRLADRVILLKDGRVTAQGSVFDLLGDLEFSAGLGMPAYGAAFAAKVAQHRPEDGLTALTFAGGGLVIGKLDRPVGAPLRVRVRAEDVMLAREEPRAISANNVLRARITAIQEGPGAQADVQLDCGGAKLVARITRASVARLELTQRHRCLRHREIGHGRSPYPACAGRLGRHCAGAIPRPDFAQDIGWRNADALDPLRRYRRAAGRCRATPSTSCRASSTSSACGPMRRPASGRALRFGGAILGRQKLGADLRELVILLVAKIEGGTYEWVQHVPIALACGCRQEQIDALEKADLAAACFDAREKVLLAFAEDVIRNVAASEANVEAAKEHFSPQEIVEIILTCGFYMTMARLTETTRVEIDAPGGAAVLESLQKMR